MGKDHLTWFDLEGFRERKHGIPGVGDLENRLTAPKELTKKLLEIGAVSIEAMLILLRAMARWGLKPWEGKLGVKVRKEAMLARDAIQSAQANVWLARGDWMTAHPEAERPTDEQVVDWLLDIELELGGVTKQGLEILLSRPVLSGGLDPEQRAAWKAMKKVLKKQGKEKDPPIMSDPEVGEDLDLWFKSMRTFGKNELIDRVQIVDKEISLMGKGKFGDKKPEHKHKGKLWALGWTAVYQPNKWGGYWNPTRAFKRMLMRFMHELEHKSSLKWLKKHFKARLAGRGDKAPVQLEVPVKELVEFWLLAFKETKQGEERIFHKDDLDIWGLAGQLARKPDELIWLEEIRELSLDRPEVKDKGEVLPEEAPLKDHLELVMKPWKEMHAKFLAQFGRESRIKRTRFGDDWAQMRAWFEALKTMVDRPELKAMEWKLAEPTLSWVDKLNFFTKVHRGTLGTLTLKFWGTLADKWRKALNPPPQKKVVQKKEEDEQEEHNWRVRCKSINVLGESQGYE